MQLTKNGGGGKKKYECLICNRCKSKNVRVEKSSNRNVVLFIRTKLILYKILLTIISVGEKKGKRKNK